MLTLQDYLAPLPELGGKAVWPGQVTEALALSLLDGTGLGIILLNASGRIEFVNDWVRRRWGGNGDISPGDGFEEVLGENRSARLASAIRLCLENRQASFLSHYLNRSLLPLLAPGQLAGGPHLSQNISVRPFADDFQNRFCLIEVSDVSVEAERERKLRGKAAELARANHELERFTYAASHDLKAPLRALSILPSWIEEDLRDGGCEIPEDVLEHLSDMRRQSSRLDRLLTDLLDYCRAGWNSSTAEPVDSAALLEEALGVIPWPEGFEVSVDGDWPSLRVAPVELSLVLRNLLGNAVKHHDRRKGRVSIAGAINPDGFEFSVQDDGPGIAAEFHDRAFEMFRTLKPRDEVEGSGLGLSMARRIVERWQGRIELTSPVQQGRGTRFRVTIPASAVGPS